MLTKKVRFAKSKHPYQWGPWINIAKLLNIPVEQAKRCTYDTCKVGFTALVDHVLDNATLW